MEVKNELEKYQKVIDSYIKKHLVKKHKEYSKVTPLASEIVKNFEDYILRGGKRIRSALIYHTYRMFHENTFAEADLKKLSMFIEYIHAFFLIHDDIMDRDSLRRGGPTMHKLYETIGTRMKMRDQKHFGMSMGILIGDLSQALAFEIVAESKIPEGIKSEVLSIITQRVNSTIFGQVHDILLADLEKFNEKDILMVHNLKTAKYTFDTPVLIGATLAKASIKEIKALNGYSIPAGIAFQIRDDILGMFGDKKKTGKSANSDIKEGKRTFLIHNALKNGTPKQIKIINKYLGKDDLEQDEADMIRQVVVDTGSLNYSKKLTEKYVNDALMSLNKLEQYKHTKGWQFLEAVAKYMVVRDL
jgi:geranylgeranyl diphosphate synthase, type I